MDTVSAAGWVSAHHESSCTPCECTLRKHTPEVCTQLRMSAHYTSALRYDEHT